MRFLYVATSCTCTCAFSKILLRLNARDFKNEAHRLALVKVVTFMTSQHRLPCLVQYDRFLRDGNDFYLIQENYQVCVHEV